MLSNIVESESDLFATPLRSISYRSLSLRLFGRESKLFLIGERKFAMLPELKSKRRRQFLLNFFISFFSISIISTGFLLMFLSQSNLARKNELNIAGQSALDSVEYFITYKVNRLTSDLEFLSNILLNHAEDSVDYSDVASIWIDYSNSRAVYDQIRYIDLDGNEIIRINYSENGAYAVAQSELQNKKDRYYFQDTVTLEQGQVFVSPLDLNIENNQIEQPLKPMIRLGKPYFNLKNQKTGVVVLNYAAKDILQQVQSIAASSSGEIYLLNEQGYWLFHETDPDLEWTFMFDPNSTVSFAAEYPEEWSAMQAGTSDSIQTENGVFHYSKLRCGNILENGVGNNAVFSQAGDWIIVDRIPSTSPEWRYYNNHIGDLLLYVFKRYYVFYIVFAGIAAITAALIVSNRLKNEQVKFYSEFDVMTNSLNRNAGIQRLNILYKELSRNNCVISVCFLDVNGLKEVNDVLGHEAGDELLITVATVIQNNIRSGDFIIRFGGDEFVVVFAGMGKDLSEQVWSRIVAAFDSINASENRPYLVSVSHGIEEISCGVTRLLDSVLHQADEKMYEEKRRIKSNLNVLR